MYKKEFIKILLDILKDEFVATITNVDNYIFIKFVNNRGIMINIQ